jgi:hypothetical protein
MIPTSALSSGSRKRRVLHASATAQQLVAAAAGPSLIAPHFRPQTSRGIEGKKVSGPENRFSCTAMAFKFKLVTPPARVQNLARNPRWRKNAASADAALADAALALARRRPTPRPTPAPCTWVFSPRPTQLAPTGTH